MCDSGQEEHTQKKEQTTYSDKRLLTGQCVGLLGILKFLKI